MMPATIEKPICNPPVVKRLTSHCIILGTSDELDRAIDRVRAQIDPTDGISVIENCHVPALTAALSNVKTDLIFFLRAGDSWAGEFLAQMRVVYQKHSAADVVTCDHFPNPLISREQTCSRSTAIDLGYSAVATYADLDYPTLSLSCFSLRRRVAERILPLVDDTDWRDQPEACLTIAASLASARRFHLPLPLVQSDFVEHIRESDFSHRLKVLRLVGKTANQLGLNPDFVKQFLIMEYSASPKDPQTITKYCRLLQAYLPDTRSRREILLSMYRNMKDHLRGDGSFSGYLRRWRIKQRLLWTGKLSV